MKLFKTIFLTLLILISLFMLFTFLGWLATGNFQSMMYWIVPIVISLGVVDLVAITTYGLEELFKLYKKEKKNVL